MSKRVQKSRLCKFLVPFATTDSKQCILSLSSVNLASFFPGTLTSGPYMNRGDTAVRNIVSGHGHC
ncbi:hypothetical protein TRIATDRAFT_299311 [Trichoderma atroviride IMI 206040]|uniref:Uncharacterized protein n=1 Tax=Hypocrea atroviridis (strain ATCC 20476 / IMI 206040) TaxID=452589 RepID=G9NU59_HYPAI|nr:uncharacterized protein TRIATDRAFT_299311 [Trichoderma atroviride IMI 206040]EHK45592.1 hypothetical protein TRIATDRAFT_299311 [Trichoderma atroviride IMI 206040]